MSLLQDRLARRWYTASIPSGRPPRPSDPFDQGARERYERELDKWDADAPARERRQMEQDAARLLDFERDLLEHLGFIEGPQAHQLLSLAMELATEMEMARYDEGEYASEPRQGEESWGDFYTRLRSHREEPSLDCVASMAQRLAVLLK